MKTSAFTQKFAILQNTETESFIK